MFTTYHQTTNRYSIDCRRIYGQFIINILYLPQNGPTFQTLWQFFWVNVFYLPQSGPTFKQIDAFLVNVLYLPQSGPTS